MPPPGIPLAAVRRTWVAWLRTHFPPITLPDHTYPGFTHPAARHCCSAATCPLDCFTVREDRLVCDIALCRTSGNLHLCTEHTCTKRFRTREFLICDITGRSYPLDFVYGECTGLDDNHDDDNDAILRAHEPMPAEPPPLALPDDAPTQAPSPTPSQPVYTSDDVWALRTRYATLLRTIVFPTATAPPGLLSAIAANTQQLWWALQYSLRTTQTAKDSLLFVVLSCMTTGYSPAHTPVIPYDVWIRDHLPPLKTLFHVSQHTKAMRKFKDTVLQWTPTQRNAWTWITSP